MKNRTKLNFFDTVMMAITFAEAGEHKEARSIMTEKIQEDRQVEYRNTTRQELEL